MQTPTVLSPTPKIVFWKRFQNGIWSISGCSQCSVASMSTPESKKKHSIQPFSVPFKLRFTILRSFVLKKAEIHSSIAPLIAYGPFSIHSSRKPQDLCKYPSFLSLLPSLWWQRVLLCLLWLEYCETKTVKCQRDYLTASGNSASGAVKSFLIVTLSLFTWTL